MKWCRADPARIVVAYPGCEQMLQIVPDTRILEKLRLSPRAYVLAVGSRNQNKNLAGIVEAAKRLRGVNVVVAGQTYKQVFSGDDVDVSSVVAAGYVTDGELRALYENAGCFVFPSLYEGFGLPPIEALLLGCPTVVSNLSAMPEICGEVAQLCDPRDPEDIAAKVRIGIEQGAKRSIQGCV